MLLLLVLILPLLLLSMLLLLVLVLPLLLLSVLLVLILPLLLLSMLLFGFGLLVPTLLLLGVVLLFALLLMLCISRSGDYEKQCQSHCAEGSSYFHKCYLHYCRDTCLLLAQACCLQIDRVADGVAEYQSSTVHLPTRCRGFSTKR
jgi:uncharacterized protein YqhQ